MEVEEQKIVKGASGLLKWLELAPFPAEGNTKLAADGGECHKFIYELLSLVNIGTSNRVLRLESDILYMHL